MSIDRDVINEWAWNQAPREHMKRSKQLIILRGLPGSGKTTLARILMLAAEPDWKNGGDRGDAIICEADQHFQHGLQYKFDATQLKEAHDKCLKKARDLMEVSESLIIVSNTSSCEWEFQAYCDAADEFGYMVHSLVVENRHGSQSVHDIPDDSIQNMRERFSVQL